MELFQVRRIYFPNISHKEVEKEFLPHLKINSWEGDGGEHAVQSTTFPVPLKSVAAGAQGSVGKLRRFFSNDIIKHS